MPGESYDLARALVASGLDPTEVLNEYPESMARSLLNAALIRSEFPPRWVLELLEGFTKGLGGKNRNRVQGKE